MQCGMHMSNRRELKSDRKMLEERLKLMYFTVPSGIPRLLESTSLTVESRPDHYQTNTYVANKQLGAVLFLASVER